MKLGPSQRRCAQWQISRVHDIAEIEVVYQVSTLVVGTHIDTVASLANYSLVSGPPTFFVLRFAFSIIHGSGSVYCTERKPKNKKRGRPGNEAKPTNNLTHLHTKYLLVTVETIWQAKRELLAVELAD